MAKDIAVVGCGYWGKNLVRNLYELGVLHTVCDVNAGVLDSMKAKYTGIKTTSHLDEVLNSSDIKAVAIATPAITHYGIARRAILTDKDVFVEKPLSVNTKEAKELIKFAKENNKLLMVGHILQYHPAVIRLKEMVEAGELGKIQYIYSNRLNIGKLRTEENILWSFAPHDISTILMLLDEEPERVTSFGGGYITEGIYDTTLTTLEFKNGVKGHIFVSWLHPYKEQRLVVVGTRAMAVFDDVGKEKLCIYPHIIEYKSGKIPVAQKAEHRAIPVEAKEPLKEELSHFIECIEKRRQPKTDGDEGLRVLKVLEKAEKSLQNSTVIASPEGAKQSQQKKGYFVHETSCIDDDVRIGEGTRIWHFSHVLKNSRIGKNCIIGQNVMIGPDVKVGDRCKIQNNVSLYKGVTMEEGVFCAPSCVFTNVYTPRAFIERKDEFLPTLVKKGASIGANATVVCGVTIGKYSFIGAGAVVKKDIPDYALVVGVPTRQIGWVCKCGVTLKEFDKKKSAQCKRCRSRYELQDKRLIAVEETV